MKDIDRAQYRLSTSFFICENYDGMARADSFINVGSVSEPSVTDNSIAGSKMITNFNNSLIKLAR